MPILSSTRQIRQALASVEIGNGFICRDHILARLKPFGFDKVSAGAFRTAFISDTMVIKVGSVNNFRSDNQLMAEYKVISNFQKDSRIAHHFPETELFLLDFPVMIQEVVKDVGVPKGGANIWEADQTIQGRRFGESLGIGDCHEFNFGWGIDSNGEEYPIFIDVDPQFDYQVRKNKKIVTWKEFLNPPSLW